MSASRPVRRGEGFHLAGYVLFALIAAGLYCSIALLPRREDSLGETVFTGVGVTFVSVLLIATIFRPVEGARQKAVMVFFTLFVAFWPIAAQHVWTFLEIFGLEAVCVSAILVGTGAIIAHAKPDRVRNAETHSRE